nr:hypothetical protein [Tanacetum cinerariifolium]
MNQNFYNSSGFDQIQPLLYLVMSEEILKAKENLMKAIQTFLKKFNCISFRETPKVLLRAWEKFFEIQHAQPEDTYELLHPLLKDLQLISEELAEYINSLSWNRHAFYDDDDEYSIQYKEYLENSSNAIAPVLPTEEPNNSLSMRDENLSTILEIESDEVVKSSVENFVPIPSEFEVTSDNERIEEADFDLEEEIRLVENLLYDNSSPRLPKELNAEIADMILESLSPSPIPVEDSDSLIKEIDLFLDTDDLMPPAIENDDHDSEGDIHFLEELLSNDTLPLPENESSNFDHYDNLTILEIESDEVVKSSVENFVPIPSEFEVTSDNESECDVPVCDDFTTFSIPLFDSDDVFSSSDDVSFSVEDVPKENFKIYSNPHFDDEKIISTKIDPHYFNAESNLIKSLLNRDTLIDSSPKETPKVLSRAWEKFFEIQHAQPEDTHELLHPLLKDLQLISEELAEYINSLSWNRHAFYDDDDEYSIHYKEYLENSSNAIAPILPTEEPNNSLSMGDENLSTILEIESDEVVKSSVENFVPIPSEFEVTSDNENTLIDSSPKFDYLLELAHIDPIPPGIDEADFDLEEEIRLVENLLYDNSSPRPPKELNAEITDMILESLSPSPIPVEDKLLSNDTLPLPKNESSNFDHYDNLSFPHPLRKPPDVEVFFDFEPDTVVLTAKVVEDTSEHQVLLHKVLATQPTLCPNIDTLLSFSSENEDKVFKPGILSYLLVSHQDKIIFDFSENPMMMYGEYISLLDVLYLHFYPP